MSAAPIVGLRTPALLIDADAVRTNLTAMIRVIGGAARWRPHVKTAKLGAVMQLMLDAGLTRFKCATTLELQALLALGARDVIVAFPHVGPNAARIIALARAHQDADVAGLVESPAHVASWRQSGVRLFIDVNSGMNRTGGTPDAARLIALAREIVAAGCQFGGLHWYDGHMHGIVDVAARDVAAHAGYDALGRLVGALVAAGITVPDVVAAGTPATPSALTYPPFANWPTRVQVSPGTVVYNDTTSLAQLPEAWGLSPAAMVQATVVSHPTPTRFTCDAGHKSVSADAGVPTCSVVGHPTWQPQKPSEEHLPVEVPAGEALPPIGTQLLLVPTHVCPTVNNFDDALFCSSGTATVEPVTARGRERPVRHAGE